MTTGIVLNQLVGRVFGGGQQEPFGPNDTDSGGIDNEDQVMLL